MVYKQNHFMNRFWSDVTSSSYDGAHDQLGAHMTIDHNMMMKNHHTQWWSIEWNHFYRWLGLCHCWGGEVTLFKAQIVSAFTRLVGCTIIIIKRPRWMVGMVSFERFLGCTTIIIARPKPAFGRQVDRRDGSVLTGKRLTPSFVPATLISELFQL